MTVTDREAPDTVTPGAPAHLDPEAREQLRADLAKAERIALDLAQVYGDTLALLSGTSLRSGRPPVARNDVPAEYVLADGRVSHVFEQARWVSKGDWIQAVHGDTDWAKVLHTPVRTSDMTGLVTRRADGSERMRWWAHTDLVRVAEAPAPDPAAWRAEAVL